MRRIFGASLLCVFIFSACAWFQPKEEKPAQELARDGMEAYQNGKYERAIEHFEKLKDWYPFSKFAILARLHPRNEAVPYVLFQIGMCYFERIDTVDRDQTSNKKALEAFDRLIKQFPEIPYAFTAAEHIKKSLKILAGHEFYIGLFYYKSKHYKAALHRFKAVISLYPDVGVHHKALRYITLCEVSIKEKESNSNNQKKR
jgi:outer membrane protein assembly factor BamD